MENNQEPITQEEIFTTIKSFTGQANILTIPRSFIDYTGDHESALLLSQLLYWSDKVKRQDGFIFKTYTGWQAEIGLNEYAVRKAANNLRKMGILKTEVHKANGNPTVHYRLTFSAFSSSFLQFLKNRNSKNQRNDSSNTEYSLTETPLTDINTKNTEGKENNAFSLLAESPATALISEIIQYYFDSYRKALRKVHPILKKKQLTRVYQEIQAFGDDTLGGNYEAFHQMIDKHFTRTDGFTTDFNINHFATEGVMRILFYRNTYFK